MGNCAVARRREATADVVCSSAIDCEHACAQVVS